MPQRPHATRSFSAAIRPFTIEAAQNWCRPGCVPTPFQSAEWLASWYRAFASEAVEPLFIEVSEAGSDAGVYALPLIRRRNAGLSVIEFADLGVTDYNLPLPGEHPPADAAEASAAWEAVRRALPAADLIELRKMPETLFDRPNPLVQALGGRRSHLSGNVIATGDDLEVWRQTLSPNNRRNFARLWRVFTRLDGARFIEARSIGEAAPILAWLEAQQSARAQEVAHMREHYLLDRPLYADFYRHHLVEGLAARRVIVTALKAGDTFVAAIYAVAADAYYAVVRLSFNADFYNCSPARLLIERSISHLHAEGFRTFDLTTGDYPYKKTFETAPLPLRDVTLARSIRGLPAAGLAGTKAFVKSYPMLERLARRLISAPPAPAGKDGGQRGEAA